MTNPEVDGDGSIGALVEDVDEQSIVSVDMDVRGVEHESELYLKTFPFEIIVFKCIQS